MDGGSRLISQTDWPSVTSTPRVSPEATEPTTPQNETVDNLRPKSHRPSRTKEPPTIEITQQNSNPDASVVTMRRARNRPMSEEDEQFERLMEMNFANKLTGKMEIIYLEQVNSQMDNAPTFEDIPAEIKYHIMEYLDAFSLAQCSLVCRAWRSLTIEKKLWAGKRKALMSRRLLTVETEEGDGYAFHNSYRIVMIGAGGVGKSSLTVRFVVGRFVEKYDPTIEDAYRIQMSIDGEVANLDIVDTAGPEEYSALRDQYIKLAAGFIVVYSVTSAHSCQAAAKLRDVILKIKGLSVEDGSCYDYPIILVGNKCDLASERTVTFEEGQAIANRCSHFTKNFFEVSARTDTNVSEIFCEMVRQIDTVEWRKNNQLSRRRENKNGKCTLITDPHEMSSKEKKAQVEAQAEALRWVNAFNTAMSSMKPVEFVSEFFGPDSTQRMGSKPRTEGLETVITQYKRVFMGLESLKHEVKGLDIIGDRIFVEEIIHYVVKGEKRLTTYDLYSDTTPIMRRFMDLYPDYPYKPGSEQYRRVLVLALPYSSHLNKFSARKRKEWLFRDDPKGCRLRENQPTATMPKTRSSSDCTKCNKRQTVHKTGLCEICRSNSDQYKQRKKQYEQSDRGRKKLLFSSKIRKDDLALFQLPDLQMMIGKICSQLENEEDAKPLLAEPPFQILENELMAPFESPLSIFEIDNSVFDRDYTNYTIFGEILHNLRPDRLDQIQEELWIHHRGRYQEALFLSIYAQAILWKKGDEDGKTSLIARLFGQNDATIMIDWNVSVDRIDILRKWLLAFVLSREGYKREALEQLQEATQTPEFGALSSWLSTDILYNMCKASSDVSLYKQVIERYETCSHVNALIARAYLCGVYLQCEQLDEAQKELESLREDCREYGMYRKRYIRAIIRLLIESSRLHLRKGEGESAILDMNNAMLFWPHMIEQDRSYIENNIKQVEEATSLEVEGRVIQSHSNLYSQFLKMC
ncbi:hypothetical protein PROFUN_00649 [Planoprotostelium fungivorum]|uniref:F-box domain-containing protein n=1 Tax=Planoprotostelium fungivorum TaxID=1890364 RepID=A0A2P6NU91_9EUKA|nr:hypothetical protein PROFUN_00649 [Planoprotostelium fungivorum]